MDATISPPAPAYTFQRFVRDVLVWLKTNVPLAAAVALGSAVVTWLINLYTMASMGGFNDVPDGSPIAAPGNTVHSSLIWGLGSMIVFGVIGYWRAVGTKRFVHDVVSFPAQVGRVVRDDGPAAYAHLLWGTAVTLVLVAFLSPWLSGVLAVGLLATLPTMLGAILVMLLFRASSTVMRQVAPGRHRLAPGPLPVLVGLLGAAAGLATGIFLTSVLLKIVLAVGCGVGAFALTRSGRVPPAVLAVAAMVLAYLVLEWFEPLLVLADDFGANEIPAGKTLLTSPGAGPAMAHAGKPAATTLLGAPLGAGIGNVLGNMPNWLLGAPNWNPWSSDTSRSHPLGGGNRDEGDDHDDQASGPLTGNVGDEGDGGLFVPPGFEGGAEEGGWTTGGDPDEEGSGDSWNGSGTVEDELPPPTEEESLPQDENGEAGGDGWDDSLDTDSPWPPSDNDTGSDTGDGPDRDAEDNDGLPPGPEGGESEPGKEPTAESDAPTSESGGNDGLPPEDEGSDGLPPRPADGGEGGQDDGATDNAGPGATVEDGTPEDTDAGLPPDTPPGGDGAGPVSTSEPGGTGAEDTDAPSDRTGEQGGDPVEAETESDADTPAEPGAEVPGGGTADSDVPGTETGEGGAPTGSEAAADGGPGAGDEGLPPDTTPSGGRAGEASTGEPGSMGTEDPGAPETPSGESGTPPGSTAADGTGPDGGKDLADRSEDGDTGTDGTGTDGGKGPAGGEATDSSGTGGPGTPSTDAAADGTGTGQGPGTQGTPPSGSATGTSTAPPGSPRGVVGADNIDPSQLKDPTAYTGPTVPTIYSGNEAVDILKEMGEITQKVDEQGNPVTDANGNPVYVPANPNDFLGGSGRPINYIDGTSENSAGEVDYVHDRPITGIRGGGYKLNDDGTIDPNNLAVTVDQAAEHADDPSYSDIPWTPVSTTGSGGGGGGQTGRGIQGGGPGGHPTTTTPPPTGDTPRTPETHPPVVQNDRPADTPPKDDTQRSTETRPPVVQDDRPADAPTTNDTRSTTETTPPPQPDKPPVSTPPQSDAPDTTETPEPSEQTPAQESVRTPRTQDELADSIKQPGTTIVDPEAAGFTNNGQFDPPPGSTDGLNPQQQQLVNGLRGGDVKIDQGRITVTPEAPINVRTQTPIGEMDVKVNSISARITVDPKTGHLQSEGSFASSGFLDQNVDEEINPMLDDINRTLDEQGLVATGIEIDNGQIRIDTEPRAR